MYRGRIGIFQGDITTLDVDAIVNAANVTLLGGGGVDGAIHRAAGPCLLEECRGLNGCETGKAKLTRGYRLKARYVIHTPGPVWKGGGFDEEKLLASCYRSVLALSKKHEFKTIAIPAISTGVYGFPKEKAARIAFGETCSFLMDSKFPEKVIFVAWDTENFNILRNLTGDEQSS